MTVLGAVLAAFSLSAYIPKWSASSCIYFQSSCIILKCFTSGIEVQKTRPPPFHVQTIIIILSDIYNLLSSVLSSPQLLRTLIRSQSDDFELQKHNSKLCIAYIAYIVLMLDKGQASLDGENSEIWYIYFFTSWDTLYVFHIH